MEFINFLKAGEESDTIAMSPTAIAATNQ